MEPTTDGEVVVFDFPAVIDLDGATLLGAERGHKLAYVGADGFTAELRDALLAAPRHRDTGALLGVGGTLALANVLLAGEDGQVSALTDAYIADGRRIDGLMKAIALSPGFRHVGGVTP